MDFTMKGDIRAHIVLRKEMAIKIIRLSHSLEKPMSYIVTKALTYYLKEFEVGDSKRQQVLI